MNPLSKQHSSPTPSIEIKLVDRKSASLCPSSLPCLAKMPTINLSSGCAHSCIYCYTKSYSQYPGDNIIAIYQNTADQVINELKRKRKKPISVYFCPSSDAFQPIPQVLDQSYKIMKTLLEDKIGVQFVTKGNIPDHFLQLFADHQGQVAGQVGITTTDQSISDILEPNAPPPQQRLSTIKALRQAGVITSARADPLIYGLTDTDSSINNLFGALADTGITTVAVSYLFLRPAIKTSLTNHITNAALLDQILKPYASSPACNPKTLGQALPQNVRQTSFDRLGRLAENFGLQLCVCGCKNGDITSQKCHLTTTIKNFA